MAGSGPDDDDAIVPPVPQEARPLPADDLSRALADESLLDELARARRAELVGPGDPADQIAHALGFAGPLAASGLTCVDLGAGGGLPGLVLARVRPHWRLALVDAAARRCRHLQGAVERLELEERVEVIHARAEDLGRGPWRAGADAVVARGFGPPAVVAECAAPLLRRGGRAVVSEPPGVTDRWPVEGLAQLGLRSVGRHQTSFGYQVLLQATACPDRFPRRPGIPAKRPLF